MLDDSFSESRLVWGDSFNSNWKSLSSLQLKYQ